MEDWKTSDFDSGYVPQSKGDDEPTVKPDFGTASQTSVMRRTDYSWRVFDKALRSMENTFPTHIEELRTFVSSTIGEEELRKYHPETYISARVWYSERRTLNKNNFNSFFKKVEKYNVDKADLLRYIRMLEK